MSVCGRTDGCIHSGVYNDFVFWGHSWRKLFSFQTFRLRVFFFFFFFFHFPSQYRFSYLKIITWTTWQACPKRRAARIHHHFPAFCVHRVTFPTIWPTLSQLPSSTPIDCACVQPISKLVRKKSKSDTLLIARHVGEVFKILPKYMHLLLWNMLTYMYRTAFQHPAGTDDP